MLVLLPIGALAVFLFLALNANAGRANEGWQAAADELGLELRPGSLFDAPRIDGRGLTVVASGGRNGHAIFTFPGLPWDMSFAPAGLWEAGSVGRERILVGDEAFDRRIKVRGDPDDVLALLDAQTRRLALELVDLGGEMGWGKLSLNMQGGVRRPDRVVAAARVVLALGERLARPGRRQQLLANVKGDPAPGVRGKSLQRLCDHFPRTGEANAAVEAALDDSDPAVRVAAAALDRGEKGRRVLRGVVADARVAAELRALALELLIGLFGYAKDLVAPALEQPEWRLRQAAVAAVGEARDHAQLDRVCALAGEEPAALGEAVAAALGRLGDARAEPALFTLLGRAEVPVRLAAAHALGLLGTVAAVERLLPLTRGILHGDVHAAAADAIRRIQERLGDAEAGQISLTTDGPAGELSIAGGGGELSRVKS